MAGSKKEPQFVEERRFERAVWWAKWALENVRDPRMVESWTEFQWKLAVKRSGANKVPSAASKTIIINLLKKRDVTV